MLLPGLLKSAMNWLFGCAEPGCPRPPVSLGYCVVHEKPYEHGPRTPWGDKEGRG